MGHATHFLKRLERVEGPALSLAMGLYRDPPLLRWALGRLFVESSVPTVALALGPGPTPPYLVITRDGQFITCLGEGMVPDAAVVVPHHRLVSAVEDGEAWREMSARNAGKARTALDRLMTAGRWLCREDMEDLLIISAMVPDYFMETTLELRKSLESFEQAFRPRDYQRGTEASRKALSVYWKHAWAHSNMSIVATEAMLHIERVRPGLIEHEVMVYLVSDQAWRYLRGPCTRAMWCLARLGKLTLPELRDWSQRKGMEAWLSPVALEAVGLRHAGTRAEIIRHLMRFVPEPLRAQLEVPDEFLHVDRAVEAHKYPGGTLTVLATQAVGVLRSLGADRSTLRASGGDDWLTETQRSRMNLLVLSDELPNYATVTDVDAWVDDLDTFALALPGLSIEEVRGHHRVTLANVCLQLPAMVRADAADLCLPRALIERLGVVNRPVDLDMVRTHLENYHARSAHGRPVKVARTPGRNEPCSCGSGKKYKVCCGR